MVIAALAFTIVFITASAALWNYAGSIDYVEAHEGILPRKSK